MSAPNLSDTISKLISIQHDLTKDLAAATSGTADYTSISNNLATITQVIAALQSQQSGLNGYVQNYLSSSDNALDAQSYAYQLINAELENSEGALNQTESDINNNLRRIEINNYYNQQFIDRTNIVKFIILLCIPVIIVFYIYKIGYISQTLLSWIMIFIIVFGCLYLWGPIIRAFSHNNMVYEQYDWNFKSANAPIVNLSNPNGTTLSPSSGQNNAQCLISKPSFFLS